MPTCSLWVRTVSTPSPVPASRSSCSAARWKRNSAPVSATHACSSALSIWWGIQAEDLVARGPALFTLWTPVVGRLKRSRAAHTHRLPCAPLVWPAMLAAPRKGCALPPGGRVVRLQRPFQHCAEHRPHDTSKDAQHTLLVLGQIRWRCSTAQCSNSLAASSSRVTIADGTGSRSMRAFLEPSVRPHRRLSC